MIAQSEIMQGQTCTSHLKLLSRRNLLKPKILMRAMRILPRGKKLMHTLLLMHNQSINDEKRPTHLWSSISRRTHSSKLAGSPSTPALDRRLAIRTIDSRNSAKSILPSPLSNDAPPPEPPVTRLRASTDLQELHVDARTACAPVAALEENVQGCCLNFLVYKPALSAPIDKVDLEGALAAADWHNNKVLVKCTHISHVI